MILLILPSNKPSPTISSLDNSTVVSYPIMIQKRLILPLAIIAIVLIVLSQFSFMPISKLNVEVDDVNFTTATASLTAHK